MSSFGNILFVVMIYLKLPARGGNQHSNGKFWASHEAFCFINIAATTNETFIINRKFVDMKSRLD
jgi:hypothetical protein